LYANPNTRGPYNLLFGLTSGGPYNYNGTHGVSLLLYSYGRWVLYLDCVGKLLHSSKVKFSPFSASALLMIIPHAGLDVYDAEIFWWLCDWDFECPTLGLCLSWLFPYVRVLQWLRNFDQRLRESMEYALDRMWMHVSKPPENAFIKQIFFVRTLSLSFDIQVLCSE
jgi:hypothetical protein